MHNCVFCGTQTREFLDFGKVALAGAFIKVAGIPGEMKYPLRITFCPECFAVQLADQVDAKTLFSEYFYFSSQINAVKAHFQKFARMLSQWFKHDTVLEIGCNDGFMLGLMADDGAKCIGVDPARNVIESCKDERLTLINDFFTDDLAEKIVKEHGKQSVVLASNVFAHIPDIHSVTRGIKRVLADDGICVIEVHDLLKMVEGLQYDWIYHEHLYYYSALSLSTHLSAYGLDVFDIDEIPAHAGSVRYFVCHKFKRNPSSEVIKRIEKERQHGLDQFATFERFSERVKSHRDELKSVVDGIKAKGHAIRGYGASGRANTILQWCGIDATHISYILDDAPSKTGYRTPGTHIGIYPPGHERATDISHTLILAWPYAEQIIPRVTGKKISVLPKVAVYD